jgi:hypothetical protein
MTAQLLLVCGRDACQTALRVVVQLQALCPVMMALAIHSLGLAPQDEHRGVEEIQAT